MGIAMTLQEYLNDQHIDYEVIAHDRTSSSLQTARASHIPGDCIAKGVVLTREGGFVMAVIPASCRVQLDAVEQMFDGPIRLATEDEISSLFPDCEAGAVPPIGAAYAVDCVVDDDLEQQAEIYLEGGDHQSLIHLPKSQFSDLMKDAPHGHIATRD